MAGSNREFVERNMASVMDTYGRQPIALVRGEGSYVWDADGKRYLDFLTGLAVCSIGHCHPKVVEAIRQQSAKLIHCSNLYHIDKQIELAERLVALSGLGKAFFCNSGAEANEGAVKLARKHAKAKHRGKPGSAPYGVITAKESFHGRTLAMVTATGQTKYQEGFEPLPTGFRYVPFNDLEALHAAVDGTTCAIMLEPVQGESGVFPCEPEYLRGVRRLCDEKGLLLILDEVQTGLGRTCKLFAHQHYGVTPDIMTLAKSLAGGMPIGCLLSTDEVASAFTKGSHASTFGGNPLACAAALAFLDVITAEGFLESSAEIAKWMADELRSWRTDEGTSIARCLGDIRTAGMMFGIDLAGVDGAEVLNAARDMGLLINSIAGRTIRLLPPLTLSAEEAREGLDTLKAALLKVKA